MTEVTVKLRWGLGPMAFRDGIADAQLMLGSIQVGSVHPSADGGFFADYYRQDGHMWRAGFPTEAEARAAVEEAVIKALGDNHDPR